MFDALDLPSETWMRRRLADAELYVDYLAALLSRTPRVRVTGDLTPDVAEVRNSSPRRIDEHPDEVAAVVATHYAATCCDVVL